MASTYFSDHYGSSDTGTPGDAITALPNPRRAVTAGIKHARKRVNICWLDTTGEDPVDGDVYRFCTMKSTDRIISIKAACDGTFSGSTDLSLGIHLAGDNNDGAVVDFDLFAAALDVGAGFVLTENVVVGALTDEDIGKMLWEQCDVGASSYGSDPGVEFDITGTIANQGAAGGEVLVIVEYTSSA
jgi:hypothetical protein